MKKAYCLLNHSLTDEQKKNLMEKFKTDWIFYPDAGIVQSWAQIKAEEELDYSLLNQIKEWLMDAVEGDLLIVQGEFGHTFYIVDFALKNGLVPVHAVSKRVSTENRVGDTTVKQNVFRHVCFRKYEYCKKV